MALSKAKIEEFVDAYFAFNMNATKAAEKCGYSSPRQHGYRVLNYKAVQEAVRLRLRQQAMSADEVIARLGAIARGSVADVCEIDETTGKPVRGLKRGVEDGTLHLVKSVSDSPKFGFSFEMYDAQAALGILAKHHGLLKEKPETGDEDALTTLRRLLTGTPEPNTDGEDHGDSEKP